jgi:N-acetylmuramoyl-L-alanine amidase
VVIAALIVAAAAASSPPAVVASLGDGATVEWLRGEAPRLLALPRAGEGWARLATRLCGGAGRTAGLRAANATLANPRRGVRVRVPWKILAPDLRVKAAEALFPQDRRTTAGWEHVTVAPWGGDGESWWELAEWFCGAGSRYQTLREANPDVELYPPKGRRLLIPNAALLPEFLRIKPEAVVAAATPPSPPPGPSPSIRGGVTPRTSPTAAAAEQAPLEYRDGEAIYRLQPHEALYSAVVVRFTGQLNASDVNATALELARKSGVSDVTSIPVGYPIRIPYELLLPQFLPPDNPKRRAWEKEKEELAAIKRAIRAANLEGIQIILDAGHGGGDTGAVAGNVWESTYVFDVMNRLRRVLESETKAAATATYCLRPVTSGCSSTRRTT